MQCSNNLGEMIHCPYPLFDFAEGESLYIPNKFSGINGWNVSLTGVDKVHNVCLL